MLGQEKEQNVTKVKDEIGKKDEIGQKKGRKQERGGRMMRQTLYQTLVLESMKQVMGKVKHEIGKEDQIGQKRKENREEERVKMGINIQKEKRKSRYRRMQKFEVMG